MVGGKSRSPHPLNCVASDLSPPVPRRICPKDRLEGSKGAPSRRRSMGVEGAWELEGNAGGSARSSSSAKLRSSIRKARDNLSQYVGSIKIRLGHQRRMWRAFPRDSGYPIAVTPLLAHHRPRTISFYYVLTLGSIFSMVCTVSRMRFF
jgi:hypothetical protein